MSGALDLFGVMALGFSGVAVALLVIAVTRAWVASLGMPQPVAVPARQRVIRRLLRCAVPIGRWIHVHLPSRLSLRLERRLAQADLDDLFDVSAWLGLLAAPCMVALVVLVLMIAAGCGSVAPFCLSAMLAVIFGGEMLIRRRMKDRERRFLKDLPAYLDVLTVCVEAGATLAVALRLAVDKAPASPARKIFGRLLHEIRMGRSRIEALNNVARLYELEALTSLVAALVQSEGHGMSLGTVLRAQSQQRATERQLRAEKAALKAPVKMLGPLVLCIFPCTFVVIAVPVLVRMFLEGG